MSALLQWIITGMLVGAAVLLLWRIFRRDPCAGCSVADICRKKSARKGAVSPHCKGNDSPTRREL